jgi:dTDP-4-dehydrorhamnose reductase
MKKIFVAGGSGLLGVGIGIKLRNCHSVVLGTHKKTINIPGCESYFLEYDSIENIYNQFAKIKPDIVINAVAITNLQECEINPTKAEIVNVKYAKNIAIACQRLNIKLVHISTDQLTKGLCPYSMETRVKPSVPLNIYAKTKALAEELVNYECQKSLIIRTNFYGWGTSYRKSFSDFIINNLRANNRITLYKDIIYTPIIREQLIKEIMALCDTDANGIFNIGSNERISKYDFGIIIAEEFKLNKNLIFSGEYSKIKEILVRPKDMSLNTDKINKYISKIRLSMDAQIKILSEQEKKGEARIICDL